MNTENLIRLFSFGLLLIFWSGLAGYMNDPQILPSPVRVLDELTELWQAGKILPNLFATISRVFWAFVFAMSIGMLLGYVMGRSAFLNAWLDPWLLVFLNLPALILIVLCYLWIGLNEMAAILAVTLNKVPLVTTIIREGARNASSELQDLSIIFRLSPLGRLRHITIPELYPQIVAAARAGFSLIWKIVLVVEFLGRGTGIGRQIHTQFSIFNVSGVLAYALSFVLFILIIEFALLQPLERHSGRWRQNAHT